MRKQRIIRRKIWRLNENQTRVRLEKRVKELVSTDVLDLWKTFTDGILKHVMKCVERRSLGEIEETCGWWNEEVKDTIARKKVAFKELCRFQSKENTTQSKSLSNQIRKIVARAMRMETNQELNDLYQNFNNIFYFLRRIKKEGKEEGA